jgi:hypothetical protein
MIDGLRIDMTTAELRERIAERMTWHRQVADQAEALVCRLKAGGGEPDMQRVIAHEAREHREQMRTLSMLHDHLVPNEVYRMGELDLRFADLVADGVYEPLELTESDAAR